MNKQKVYLLYALYPCGDWRDDHGATRDCDCDEFLEGVFSTSQKAKDYIPVSLDGDHVNLNWHPSSLNSRNEVAPTPNPAMWYVIQPMSLD